MTRVPAHAVIPAAGLGRRNHPVTRAVPKEMFPLGRHPAIEWVIAEAIASGCTRIAVVLSPAKAMIRSYLLEHCPALAARCELSFLDQPRPLGLGDALLLARGFCRDEPFAVLLPDDLVAAPTPPLLELAAAPGGCRFSVTPEPSDRAARYGRLRLEPVAPRVHRVLSVGPRMSADPAASALAGVGRALFAPVFLEHAARLRHAAPDGELDDADIFRSMLGAGVDLHVVELTGHRFDISTTAGYRGAWDRLATGSPYTAWSRGSPSTELRPRLS